MTPPGAKKRVLSGVQPSGKLHLGNYFGALQQHLKAASDPDLTCYFFIADYHALTTLQDARALRENVRDVALDYLALGLSVDRCAFFRQSDVPEVCELAWLLSTVTGMGLLQRAHSFKDKVAQGITPSVGLFTYPILMAADILAYDSDWVPVGQDQIQHVEMARDMAGYFNEAYGEVFVMPAAKMTAEAAKVPGVDGRKMSKSYGNTIPIFMTGKPLRKIIMAITTDSLPVESPKNPETCNLFAIFSLFLNESEKTDLAARYRAGNLAYGHVKEELYQRMEKFFEAARAERARLEKDPAIVEAALKQGAEKAHQVAGKTLARARAACGLSISE